MHEIDACTAQARRARHEEASTSGQGPLPASAAAVPASLGMLQEITAGFKEQLVALKEGAVYISDPQNK